MRPEYAGMLLGQAIVAPLMFATMSWRPALTLCAFTFVATFLIFKLIKAVVDAGWVR